MFNTVSPSLRKMASIELLFAYVWGWRGWILLVKAEGPDIEWITYSIVSIKERLCYEWIY